MARVCDICNKGLLFGNTRSHSNRKARRTWAPNIKRVRAIVEGSHKTVSVCTRCLRSGKVERSI